LELLIESEIVRAERVAELIGEALELLAIVSASQRTARRTPKKIEDRSQ